MIRLGLRVRPEDTEVAYARLESLLSAGFEEVPFGDLVEFVVYGEDIPDPTFPELVSVSRTPVAEGWETAWHEHLEPVTVGALTIRPPWIPGEGIVVDPGVTFGLAQHPTTRLCLALLQDHARAQGLTHCTRPTATPPLRAQGLTPRSDPCGSSSRSTSPRTSATPSPRSAPPPTKRSGAPSRPRRCTSRSPSSALAQRPSWT